MPTRPNLVTFTNTSVDVLNAIRNDATQNYRDYVPFATADGDVIRTIGATLMDYPELQNEFLQALVNRIARVIVTSKMYKNPWEMFKQGRMDLGETIEEVYVDLCKVHQFDPATAENKVFAREIPNVRSAFHVLNYQKFYKQSIGEAELKRAFLSIEGVNDLISKIVEAMVTAAAYDEFIVMKFMLQYRMCIGAMYPVKLTAEGGGVSHADAVKGDAEMFKAMSNKLTFMSPNYNLAGVYNATEKSNQYLIIDTDFDAAMDVQVLATAFNMEKAEFMGHRILVDSFATVDEARLDEIFNNDDSSSPALDPTYYAMKQAMGISNGSISALSGVKAVLVDEEFWKVFDNLDTTETLRNPEGLYMNYWYHVAKTFSVSPFANAVAFSETALTVTSVTVSPSTATVLPTAGIQIPFSATVVTTGITPKSVEWSLSANAKATIDQRGVVTLTTGVADGQTITVTAKSTYDNTVYGTATITVDDGEE